MRPFYFHLSALLLLLLLVCSRIDAAAKASSSSPAKASSAKASSAKASSAKAPSAKASSSLPAKVSSTSTPSAATPVANSVQSPLCGQCNAMHIMLLGCQIPDASAATVQQVGCFCTQAFVNNYAACTTCIANTDTKIPLLLPSVQSIISGCNSLLNSTTSSPNLQLVTGPGTIANNTIALPPPGYLGSNWSAPVGSVQTTMVSQTPTASAGSMTSAAAMAGRIYGGVGVWVGMVGVMVVVGMV